MAYTLKVNYADKSNYGSARSSSSIKYIVVHYTANDGDTDEANARYFKNNKNLKASAHYFVDDDSITISVPDNYVAYSVGGSRYSNYKTTGGAKYYKVCTNANSLSIELCDTVKNGVYSPSEKTLENAAALVKDLMKKYNISINNVIRHFDVTGKSCPAYFVDNSKWNEFKNRISSSTSNSTIYSSTNTTLAKTYTVVRGDTLSKIGTKTGVNWKTIADLNGIKSPYTIKVGQVLKLSTSTSAVTKPVTVPTTTASPSPYPSSAYTHKDFVKEIQSAIGAKVDGIAGTETLSKTVTVSMTKNRKHAVVKPIQKYLNSIGYSAGTADGIAGAKFNSAVKAFQKANGCTSDGEVTAKGKTWKKLLKLA